MKTPRKLLWPLAALILIAAGFFVYRHYYLTDTADDLQTQSEKAAAKADADSKKQLIENKDGTANGSNNPSAPPDSGSKITSLTAKQESNGTVTVLTKLVSGTEGKCELSIKNGSQTTSRSAEIIYQPEFSTCAGFSLPVSSVGYGQWDITLSAGGSAKTTVLEVSR